MKTKLFLTVAFFLSLTTFAGAQQQEIAANRLVEKSTTTTAPLLEPEWPGQVLRIEGEKLLPLESQKLFNEIRTKKMGFAGGEQVFFVNGTTSSVEVNSTPEFIVRMEIKSEPSALINIDRVKPAKGNRREVIVASQKGPLGGKTSTEEPSAVQLIFEKYSGESIKFKPTAALTPGEYMVTTTGSGGMAYLFRVE